jgi:cell wall-associated NlpC family hydrolase
MGLTTNQRAQITAEAVSWIGTPYRGWSRIKRMGVDCGQLLAGVFINTGFLPANLELPKDYSLQVAQHIEDTAYIEKVEEYMREIPEHEVQPGDVVVYKLGLAFAHAGFVISWPGAIVHAMAHHGVTLAHGCDHPKLRRTTRKFYTLKDEYANGKEI